LRLKNIFAILQLSPPAFRSEFKDTKSNYFKVMRSYWLEDGGKNNISYYKKLIRFTF